MTYQTEQQAAKLLCPIARTFEQSKGKHCKGSECILWRWRPMAAADNRYKSAVERVQMDMFDAAQKKAPDAKRTVASFHKQAVAKVAEQPWDFIFMDPDKDRGYCGLGGTP